MSFLFFRPPVTLQGRGGKNFVSRIELNRNFLNSPLLPAEFAAFLLSHQVLHTCDLPLMRGGNHARNSLRCRNFQHSQRLLHRAGPVIHKNGIMCECISIISFIFVTVFVICFFPFVLFFLLDSGNLHMYV